MEIDIERLADAIDALTAKLDGIGIEIFHLNSSIASLKEIIKNKADDFMEGVGRE